MGNHKKKPLQIFNQSCSRYSTKIVSMMTLVSSLSASLVNVESTKAASPYVNLGCQCSSLTFVDQYGTVQGNCRSADSTGALWCYVDSAYSSTCQDKQFSARFPNNPWSYEACATPLPVVVAPAAPSAAFTAPIPVQPSYPSVPAHVPAHSHQVPAHAHVPVQSGAFTSDLDPTLEPSSLMVNSSQRSPAVEMMLSSFKIKININLISIAFGWLLINIRVQK